jgi:hypothetical protein
MLFPCRQIFPDTIVSIAYDSANMDMAAWVDWSLFISLTISLKYNQVTEIAGLSIQFPPISESPVSSAEHSRIGNFLSSKALRKIQRCNVKREIGEVGWR